jgi:hypothetical protein
MLLPRMRLFWRFFPLVSLSFQNFGHLKESQRQASSPQFVVEGSGTDQLTLLEQPVKPCVAGTGIKRPVIFPYLLHDPNCKRAGAIQFVRLVAACSVCAVNCVTTLCRISRGFCPCCSAGAGCHDAARYQWWLGRSQSLSRLLGLSSQAASGVESHLCLLFANAVLVCALVVLWYNLGSP